MGHPVYGLQNALFLMTSTVRFFDLKSMGFSQPANFFLVDLTRPKLSPHFSRVSGSLLWTFLEVASLLLTGRVAVGGSRERSSRGSASRRRSRKWARWWRLQTWQYHQWDRTRCWQHRLWWYCHRDKIEDSKNGDTERDDVKYRMEVNVEMHAKDGNGETWWGRHEWIFSYAR